MSTSIASQAQELGLSTAEHFPASVYDSCSVLVTEASGMASERVRSLLHPDGGMRRIDTDVTLLRSDVSVGIARLCVECAKNVKDRMALFECVAGKNAQK